MEEEIKFASDESQEKHKTDHDTGMEPSEDNTNIGVYSIVTFTQPILWIWSKRSILFKNLITVPALKDRFEEILSKFNDLS